MHTSFIRGFIAYLAGGMVAHKRTSIQTFISKYHHL